MDADRLLAASRFDNASHLAGFAAECALKAVLCSAGNVGTPSSGPPTVHVSGKKISLSHLPKVWNDAGLYLQGLTAFTVPQLSALLRGKNPFDGLKGEKPWDIGDRYEADGVVTPSIARRHRDGAARIVSIMQTAHLNGIVP